jgi:hypothetical protein
MTDRARYHFRVSEYETNKFWIIAEPRSSDIKILKHGLLGFNLTPDIDSARAKEVADFFNENVVTISYTGLGT